jgi:alpha,alpha-trehalase
LSDNEIQLAKDIVDNFSYQIVHYGKILNANRTYYLTRSQPPFFSSMIRAVWEVLPKNKEAKEWLKTSLLAAIKEYQEVWMSGDRLTSIGLNRYAGFAQGIPPEVEAGHFSHILKPYAQKHQLSLLEFEKAYNQGKIKEPELDQFFAHDRAVRESGHDTTYRWRVGEKDLCADFVTIDLNALLYKYELDLAWLIQSEFAGLLDNFKSRDFYDAAKKRKELIRRYLWDPRQNLFFDYDWVRNRSSNYLSATTLYPLWTYDQNDPSTRILSYVEAKKLVSHAFTELEQEGGISATASSSLIKWGDLEHERQWEYPNGWAPHQMITWQGLKNYGWHDKADRLIYKWLYMITANAMDYHGTIPEKYDVVKRSHHVFAEYGNVGTKFDYITREGFGWMNASFQVGLQLLGDEKKVMLKQMFPVEEVFNKKK